MPWINPLMANFWVIALMANLLIIYNFEKKKFRFVRFWFFLLIIITTKQDLFYSVFEIVFCFFKFFSTHSTGKNGTEIEAKTFFWVAPYPLWSENSRSIHRRSRGKASWMHRVCLGLESQTKIWKVRNVVPRPTWSGKLRRLCLVRKTFFLGCAVSALVWNLALYPPKVARESFLNAPRLPWSGKSHLNLESPECLAASDLIWKIALPPPCPENCAAINKGAKSAQQKFLPRCFELLSHFLSVQLMLKSRQLRNFQDWWCYNCRTLWFFFNCLVECCSDIILKILKHLEFLNNSF